MPRKRQQRAELPDVGGVVRWLLDASSATVRACELARLEEAANLHRELTTLLTHAVEVRAEAMVCRLVLELRGRLHRPRDRELGPGGGPRARFLSEPEC